MSLARAAIAGAFVAAGIWACTLTRSLEYLQDGVTDGGGMPVGAQESGSEGSEAGNAPDPSSVVAPGQMLPANLAQDADNLYWSLGDGSIMTVAKTGGDVRKVGAAVGGVIALAADPGAGGDLFVIAGNKAHRLPKAGGDLEVLDGDAPPPIALAVDDAYVFVLHNDDALLEGHVARWNKGGGGRAILSLELDFPVAVALQGVSVFWSGSTEDGDLVVFQLPRDAPNDAGGAAQVFSGGAAGIDVQSSTGLAVDDQAIYWLDYETSNTYLLQRGAPAASTQQLLAAPPGSMHVAIALDAEHVYILDQRAGGGIVRMKKSGADAQPFVPNAPVPTSFVVDDRALYYTIQGEALGAVGAVLRAPTK